MPLRRNPIRKTGLPSDRQSDIRSNPAFRRVTGLCRPIFGTHSARFSPTGVHFTLPSKHATDIFAFPAEKVYRGRQSEAILGPDESTPGSAMHTTGFFNNRPMSRINGCGRTGHHGFVLSFFAGSSAAGGCSRAFSIVRRVGDATQPERLFLLCGPGIFPGRDIERIPHQRSIPFHLGIPLHGFGNT